VLKPELFEGLRFDFTKPLNQNFALSHRCLQSISYKTHWTPATCAILGQPYTARLHPMASCYFSVATDSIATSRYGTLAVLMVKIACCSIFMGNMEVPTTNQQVVKMPLGTYEFGANLVSNQVGGTA